MAAQGVDVLLLSVGPDLPWLTGYEAMPLERLTMLVVPRDGDATLVVATGELGELGIAPRHAPLITRLNQIRVANPALQSTERLHFHPTDNPSLICYSKRTADGGNLILVVVNLDPFLVQAGWVNLDLDVLGLTSGGTFEVYDLLADHSYRWQGSRNYVALRPAEAPAHVFRVMPAGEKFKATTVVTI